MRGDFFDSNVFLYLFDETAPAKRAVAERLINTALVSQKGTISFQVVQETLNVITRKMATPANPTDTRRFLEHVLAPLWNIHPSLSLYHRALEVQARYRFSFYDALIIAAALEAGCTRLYTEDLQPGQGIENLTIENPFLGIPPS